MSPAAGGAVGHVHLRIEIAQQIVDRAGLKPRNRTSTIVRKEVDALYRAINDPATKIMAPPTNCLSPIGMQELLAGLTRGVKAEFYTVETRKNVADLERKMTTLNRSTLERFSLETQTKI